MKRHGQRFVKIPLAQSLLCSYYSQSLTLAQLRCSHRKTQSLGIGSRLHWLRLHVVDTVGEGTAVEVGILGHCIPTVVHYIIGSCTARQVEYVLHRLPFITLNRITHLHLIIIYKCRVCFTVFKVAPPFNSVNGGHTISLHFIILDNVE